MILPVYQELKAELHLLSESFVMTVDNPLQLKDCILAEKGQDMPVELPQRRWMEFILQRKLF